MKTAVSIVDDAFTLTEKLPTQGVSIKIIKLKGCSSIPVWCKVSSMIETRILYISGNTRIRGMDAERNTREFLAAMPTWRAHGVLAFTINLQGGSPEGYSKAQPWHNSGIEADGSLNPEYLSRLERIIDFADDLGMVVILGYFYSGRISEFRTKTLSKTLLTMRPVGSSTKDIPTLLLK